MPENSDRPSFPDWITLKQAALLLNCSIKTIRRRVESGKMKSMVEYRGNKAIRLVSREDVLREAPSFDLILAASHPRAESGNAPGLVSADTEQMLRLAVSEWHRRSDSGLRRTRILLLVGMGAVLLALVGAVMLSADWFYRLSRDDARSLKGELGTLVAGAIGRASCRERVYGLV